MQEVKMKEEDIELNNKMRVIEEATNIKQLNLQNEKNKRVVMSHKKEYLDTNTGEVVATEQVNLLKSETRDEFLKLFIHNIDYLGKELEASEFKTFFFVLQKVNYHNCLYIDASFKSDLQKKYSVSAATISRAVKGLEEKNVIIPLSDELRNKYDMFAKNPYIVNPNFIGRGSFRDLKQLRQEVVSVFDFESYEFKKIRNTSAVYKDGTEILQNPDDFIVQQIEVNQDEEQRQQNTNILIKEKNDDKTIDILHSNNQKNIEEPSLFLEENDEEIETQSISDESLKLQIRMQELKLQQEQEKSKTMQLQLKQQELEFKQKLLKENNNDISKVNEFLALTILNK